MSIETRPSAVLWDFDGTLLDTEGSWMACQERLLASYGTTWTTEQSLQLVGMPQEANTSLMYAEIEAQTGARPDMSEDDFWTLLSTRVVEALAAEELPWCPGVPELLAELQERGMPMAVYSSSPRHMLEAAISRMPAGLFSTVVSGSELANSKPAPDGYLLAARELGFDIYDCLVIEDSEPGVAAGRASGAVVVAVPSIKPLPADEGQINLASLEGVTVSDLESFWHQIRNEEQARTAGE